MEVTDSGTLSNASINDHSGNVSSTSEDQGDMTPDDNNVSQSSR